MLSELARITMAPLMLVSLEHIKAYLHIDHEEHNEILTILAGTAYAWLEDYCGKSILTTQWKLTWQPNNKNFLQSIPLPNPPILSIDEVWEVKSLTIRRKHAQFKLAQSGERFDLWINTGNYELQVIYTAGFGPHPRFVPSAYSAAMLGLIKHYYDQHLNNNGSSFPGWLLSIVQPLRILQIS